MKPRAAVVLIITFFVAAVAAQQPAQNSSNPVPHLIPYSGVARDVNGQPLSGTVGITFLLYQREQGGSPLWLETQNVQADARGEYSVQLGATLPNGMPKDLFVSGEARWLALQIAGQAESGRVMLLSVPYALKAEDAATVGGLPPSAFLLAAPQNPARSGTSSGSSNTNGNSPPLGGSGSINYLAIWTDNNGNLGDSAIFQGGTASKPKIGIGTTKPAATLDVKGGSTIRGLFSLPAAGTATAAAGFNSQPIDLVSSAFNSGTDTAVNQTFQWQSEPVGNNTSNATGSLNLLFAQGTSKPSETGLNIASNGEITFAKGQTFPGTGTVMSVGSGLGLKGGPITSSGTLTIDTTVVPQLNVANTFTANQTVNGNVSATQIISNAAQGTAPLQVTSTTQISNLNASLLGGFSAASFQPAGSYATTGANTFTGNQTVNGNVSATGLVTGSAFNLGSNLFAFGSYQSDNAFLGFAGNPATTGAGNTASGIRALASNTTGNYNTASGGETLSQNTTGIYNTASGLAALNQNSTGSANTSNGSFSLFLNTGDSNGNGSANTADGSSALYNNTIGNFNTGSGVEALSPNTTGNFNTGVGGLAGKTIDTSKITGSSNTLLGYSAALSTGTLNNATAVGAQAVVGQSNSLVLGSINGVNGASADTTVGIGTMTPVFSGLPDNSTTTLNVVGHSTYVPLVVQSPSTFGTWMLLNNTGSGGKTWAILSAGSGNAEGAGNLGITNLGKGGKIILESDVQVTGNLSKGGGSFKIDHPLDPANKYLYHSFVESPDMMNVYNGNVKTDRRGRAVIILPDYFEALNHDFRYQLTVIGEFAQAIVATEIHNNRFAIETSRPGVKVSWQVTGVRHDAWADAHRIPVEEDKGVERGHYLHPELFGVSPEHAIGMLSSLPKADDRSQPLSSERKY